MISDIDWSDADTDTKGSSSDHSILHSGISIFRSMLYCQRSYLWAWTWTISYLSRAVFSLSLEIDLLNLHNSSGLTPVAVSAGRGGAWLTEACGIWIKHWLPWTVVTLALIGYSLVINLIPFGGMMSSLLLPAIVAGLMLVCRDTESGDQDFAGAFGRGFRQRLTQSLLLGAAYLGGIAVILILLVILFISALGGFGIIMELMSGDPGLLTPALVMQLLLALLVALLLYLPLLMAFWFAPALVALGNQEAIPAMVASFRACLINFIPFLVYGLIGLVLTLLATLPLVPVWLILLVRGWWSMRVLYWSILILMLVLIPVLIISVYTAYRDIFERQPGNANQVE